MYCTAFKHVTGSATEATNTVEKCNAIVVKECFHTNFFNWRESNNACHCAETSNCDSPTANSGINIYQTPDTSTCTPGNHCAKKCLKMQKVNKIFFSSLEFSWRELFCFFVKNFFLFVFRRLAPV